MTEETITNQSGVHIVVGDEKWFNFAANYQHGEKGFSIYFYARSYEEAVEMLRSIRTTAVECHQIIQEIPAVPGAGIFVRFMCVLKNLFRT